MSRKIKDASFIFNKFNDNAKSKYKIKKETDGLNIDLEWIDKMEEAVPYIDNIFDAPKRFIVNEEIILDIEKTKKVTIESIKHLAKHTNFISEYKEDEDFIKPSKLLNVLKEETFNTYENRFIYTLIDNLIRFITKREIMLEEFEVNNNKTLEYVGSTNTFNESIKIELKITSKETLDSENDNDFQNEINEIRKRLKKIKQFINSWKRSEFIKSLEKQHVSLVIPPIKKTNLILKNPNFQVATRLWEYLRIYDLKNSDNSRKGMDINDNNTLKDILDVAFFSNYVVLDSISSSKREQKNNLSKYAVVMINEQIKRAISLLLNSGVKISDEEILSMIAEDIKNEKNKKLVGSTDVKNKFKSAMDEYLERTQNYL